MKKIAVLMTVLGLLAGALLAGLLLRPAKPPLPTGPSCGGAAVVVANQKIESGTVLEPGMISTTTVRHELMLGDLIGEEVAEFIAGIPLKNSLRRGDLLRWSDFDARAILESASTPERASSKLLTRAATAGKPPWLLLWPAPRAPSFTQTRQHTPNASRIHGIIVL